MDLLSHDPYHHHAMNRRTFLALPMIGLLALTLSAFRSTAETPADDQPSPLGRGLYEANCARCHGLDGAKGKWGARDLRKSRMNDTAIAGQIRSGKGIMPAFEKKMSAQEIAAVLGYVKTLRMQ
jgi:cytochrome c6